MHAWPRSVWSLWTMCVLRRTSCSSCLTQRIGLQSLQSGCLTGIRKLGLPRMATAVSKSVAWPREGRRTARRVGLCKGYSSNSSSLCQLPPLVKMLVSISVGSKHFFLGKVKLFSNYSNLVKLGYIFSLKQLLKFCI